MMPDPGPSQITAPRSHETFRTSILTPALVRAVRLYLRPSPQEILPLQMQSPADDHKNTVSLLPEAKLIHVSLCTQP